MGFYELYHKGDLIGTNSDGDDRNSRTGSEQHPPFQCRVSAEATSAGESTGCQRESERGDHGNEIVWILPSQSQRLQIVRV